MKEDIWVQPVAQQHDSRLTSINSAQTPKTLKLVESSLAVGQVWLDIGGGRFDNLIEKFSEHGAKLFVYDPYNRSAEYNRESLSQALQCDGVMVNNVLNVIAEPENRRRVVEQAHSVLKNGALAYFLIYEGDKTGVSRVTKKNAESSSYQMNQKAEFYQSEIQAVFGEHVYVQGSFLVASRGPNLEILKKKAKSLGLYRHKNPVDLPLGAQNNIEVGKMIGGSLYMHKSYSHVLPQAMLDKAILHLKMQRPDFEYDVIKYHKSGFSFIACPEFDSKPEPAVGESLMVSREGTVSSTRAKSDPQIYHHKWLFVADDYQGFEVAESIGRSLDWKSRLGHNREVSSRIGTQSYWNKWISKQ